MSEEIRDLIALIRAHLRRLDDVYGSIEGALGHEIVQLGRTPVSALIVAGLLENYYTCLETVFLRISQSFENRLDPARWHNDLLQKMTLEIEGVRTAAVSEAAFSDRAARTLLGCERGGVGKTASPDRARCHRPLWPGGWEHWSSRQGIEGA